MMPVSKSLIGAALAACAIGAIAFLGANAFMAPSALAQDPGETKKPTAPLNTIAEVFAALEACWIPPGLDQARAGMQITVMVSFKRSGELLGKPRITYETPEASDDERLSYRVAMAEALRRCTPLPFTDALGGALAGRPMTLRFIDNRKLKQATLEQAGTAHDRQS
jgi:hypothetical protein